MNFFAAVQLALRALWRNKTRAMLTTLGVVIGVASVIAMVAIGSGAQQRIAAQLTSMGTNTLVIRPGSWRCPYRSGHEKQSQTGGCRGDS